MNKKKDEVIVNFSSPFSKNNFTSLAISVYHAKAGYNYFTGNRSEGGHKLSFNPCSVSLSDNGTSIRTSVLMSGDQWESGFYVMLDNAQRKNPHYIGRVMAELENRKNEIKTAFEAKNSEALRIIAKQLNAKAEKLPSKPVKIADKKFHQILN